MRVYVCVYMCTHERERVGYEGRMKTWVKISIKDRQKQSKKRLKTENLSFFVPPINIQEYNRCILI